MVEGVLVTDLDGRVVLLNARARELLALCHRAVELRTAAHRAGPRAQRSLEIPRRLVTGDAVVSREVCAERARAECRWLQVNGARSAPRTASRSDSSACCTTSPSCVASRRFGATSSPTYSH